MKSFHHSSVVSTKMETYHIMSALVVAVVLFAAKGEATILEPENLMADMDVEGWLETYGYMDNIPANIVGDELVSIVERDKQVQNAVKDFQFFYGLPVSGKVDRETLNWMKKPRCGVKDEEQNTEDPSDKPHKYSRLASKWKNEIVTWNLRIPTRKLPSNDQRKTFSAAFKIWEDVIPLRIQETSRIPDIDIVFARGEHGDGVGNAFDGKSRTLAHAFGPGPAPISGDAHFDDDEDWTLNPDEGSDLLVVSAHEFGHSLGLGHSRDQKALMFPSYQKQEILTLGYDDIRGIQTIYGSPGVNRGITRNPNTRAPHTMAPYTRAPTRAPYTRAPTRAPYTVAPATRPTTSPPPCNVQFDAIVEGPRRYYYAIKDGHTFKFRADELVSDLPLSEVFSPGPTSIDMAFSVLRTSNIYLIKGDQVWCYTNLKLDEGYPKVFNRSQLPESPTFVISLMDNSGRSRIIMFGSTKWWFYRFDKENNFNTHDIDYNFRGVPSDVHYSVRWTDNNYYLITSDGHVAFDHNRRAASKDGLVSGLPSWLDRPCHAMSDTLDEMQPNRAASRGYNPKVVLLMTGIIALYEVLVS